VVSIEISTEGKKNIQGSTKGTLQELILMIFFLCTAKLAFGKNKQKCDGSNLLTAAQ
jgi:hypothetical protein